MLALGDWAAVDDITPLRSASISSLGRRSRSLMPNFFRVMLCLVLNLFLSLPSSNSRSAGERSMLKSCFISSLYLSSASCIAESKVALSLGER